MVWLVVLLPLSLCLFVVYFYNLSLFSLLLTNYTELYPLLDELRSRPLDYLYTYPLFDVHLQIIGYFHPNYYRSFMYYLIERFYLSEIKDGNIKYSPELMNRVHEFNQPFVYKYKEFFYYTFIYGQAENEYYQRLDEIYDEFNEHTWMYISYSAGFVYTGRNRFSFSKKAICSQKNEDKNPLDTLFGIDPNKDSFNPTILCWIETLVLVTGYWFLFLIFALVYTRQ